MSTMLSSEDAIHAKIASEHLFRALAKYHLRRAPCIETRNHWRAQLGLKPLREKQTRELRKPMMLADTAVDAILSKATELTGIQLDELFCRDKDRKRVKARKAICYALHIRHPELSLARIAQAVGRTDHTTACHALQTAAHIYPRQPDFKALVDALVAA